MLIKLKRNLILMYMGSTSLILTLVIVILFISSINQAMYFEKTSFQNLVYPLVSSVKTEYQIDNTKVIKVEKIKDSQLSELEKTCKMIINMKEINPDFKGGWNPKTNREILLKRLKGELDKIMISSNLFKENEIQKPIITIKGDKNDYYYGTSVSIEGLREDIYVMYYIDYERIIPLKKVVTYALIELIGLLALFLVSRLLVRKSLEPVELNIKKQKEFVAAASHELKSPLAVIMANASAIKFKPSATSEYIKGINSECKRMSRLIQDLLFLTSSDSHKWSIKKEYIDTETFLIEVYEIYSAFCAERNYNLKLNLPKEEMPSIYVDKERLLQVFSVLIDNAVSYSGGNSDITINCFMKGEAICFEFEDHGIGIPDSKKENVFNRFYKVDNSRTDKKHFGLGLSIAFEIVKLHNGQIDLRDTLNGGCTFTVTLPIND